MNKSVPIYKNCPYCSSTEISPIVSYRHYWSECLNCGCIIRTTTKDKYFVEYLVPKSLLRFLYNKTINNYIRDKAKKSIAFHIHRFVRHFANYYFKPFLEFQDGATYTDKTYFNLSQADIDAKKHVYQHISRILHETNTKLDGHNILDISGGTGWLQYYIENDKSIQYKPIVSSTEYQESACKAVEKNTGYKFIKFDYSKDKLGDVFKDAKFDTIFIIMSLGFCQDINTFFAEVKKVLKNNESRIIIYYPTPTLASCIVWLRQEYTFLTLYSPSIMNKTLKANGFSLLKEEESKSFHISLVATLFLNLWVVKFYQLLNRIKYKNSNRDVYCRGMLAIYNNS